MKQFYRRLPFKAAACVLAALLGAACLCCAALSLYLGNEGYYLPGFSGPADTQAYRSAVWNQAYAALTLYRRSSGGDIYYRLGYPITFENFAYEIVLESKPDHILASGGPSLGRPWDGEERFNWWDNETQEERNYAVYYAVRESLVPDSLFYMIQQTFMFLFPYRYTVLNGFAGTLILFLLLSLFLARAAGRRPGVEGIAPGPLSRVPFDIFLAVAGIPAFLLGYYALRDILYGVPVYGWSPAIFYLGAPYDGSRSEPLFTYSILKCGALVLAVSLALAILLTFAVRVKTGQWWRNTVIFRVLALAWRAVYAAGRLSALVVRTLPLFWKLPLVFLGVQLANVLLVCWLIKWRDLDIPVFLGFFLNLAALLLVCYTGMCMQALKKAGKRLAEGDLSGGGTEKQWLRLDFLEHARHLDAIGEGISRAVEDRIRGERLKTELITNVSHDIKTPLTSIINYVDLLSKEDLPERTGEYVAVLKRQAGRLGKLTDDLIEASKASTGNVQVNLQKTGLCELIHQAVGEYGERLNASDLEPVISAPEDEVYVMADGRHLWRVMDNLLSNICKYSLPGARVYVDVRPENSHVAVIFKNISKERLNIDSRELTERFVRGDVARSAEGSGLGLNIARSLTELQRGTFALLIDGDLFKAELRLPAAG
jgi:signal transduction histidine kinase